jgi:hypothetical protein
MHTLILDNAVLLWGLFGVLFGAYRIVTGHYAFKYLLWIVAGLITVTVVILDHTLFIDMSRAGQSELAARLYSSTDILLIVVWAIIGYLENIFTR